MPNKTFSFLIIFFVLIGCQNSSKEINDFLADQNLPIGVAENIHHVYKDSGRITSRLKAPIFWDYSNRNLNPYSEFPKGIEITNIHKTTQDSVTIAGDYAISFTHTSFSEIIGNVVVTNHQEKVQLHTEKMYWDQKLRYFFSESPFTIYTQKDTIHGVGFESESNLNNWILNKTFGNFTPQ